ncbi:ATP-binding protein [Sulfuritalea sp.]|uniref:ATP-binding protein n=1 Tax=Sulfuritalea sp. TaxID=2480090 RepID=UPI00286E0DB7|nr:ATP-binding protein [Sulfuritalea sp.]
MAAPLHFKTNTLLKNLVGKDLINDDDIAIVELVKNAYDANSESVSVKFEGFSDNGETTPDARIVVADEGTGMSLADIKDKWLNIAYSEKKLAPQENGAYYAGNKGIGRFSCDRLGTHLDLITRAKGGKLLHLELNWPDFEIEGEIDLTIQEIDIAISNIRESRAVELAGIKAFPEHGTVLVISNPRSKWDRDRLLHLKRSLEKFLNPNQTFLRNRFKVTLSVPELKSGDKDKDYTDRVHGEIKNQIFDKLQFRSSYIEATISPKEGTIATELFHEGEPVFRLVERNDAYPLLKDVRAVVYFLNPYKKAYFKRQTGLRLVSFGSIFLFLNGFRVAPYGDRGNDWLGLDVRKTQGTTRYLGNRDIVGRIEVSGSEDDFKPVSSREGLKNTKAFGQLREGFFLDVLRRLERFVVDGLGWDSVSPTLNSALRNEEGLDWNDTPEEYTESWDRKRQRIALSILTLIGSSPDRIVSFWFSPALLEHVYQTRTDEVKSLLATIEGVDPEKVDKNLKQGLARIRALVEQKEQEAAAAKKQSSELRVTVASQTQKIRKLEGERETYRAQTLFLQSVATHDAKDLVAFHHQINLDSEIVQNYLAKAIRAAKGLSGSKSVIEFLEKAALTNRRIAAVAQFATKANFRAAARKELTDIPAFVQQYLTHVAKDFSAASLDLKVDNSVAEAFEVKVSRIELSILIDNIINNASKALAGKLLVTIKLVGRNTLNISFLDDGQGLSKQLPSVDAMFDIGITTTSGSGLGLFHARKIVEEMGGKIVAIPRSPKGMEIRVEVTR